MRRDGALRPRRRDGLIIGMQLEPPVLDPTANPAAAISEALYGNLYEGLVQFAPDGSVLPSLAESWEISERRADLCVSPARRRALPQRRRLRCRHRQVLPGSRAGARFGQSAALAHRRHSFGARSLDDRTLSLSLARRSGGLLQSLAWASFVMVEPRSAATNSMHPVGTGPFRFLSWSRGDSLTLERNPGYWGGPAALEPGDLQVHHRSDRRVRGVDGGRRRCVLELSGAGELCAVRGRSAFQGVRRQHGERDRARAQQSPPAARQPAGAARHRVRLDRHAIIDGAMFGYGTPIGSHFPPHSPDYVDLTELYPHDVARAKALLARGRAIRTASR